ncbi:MAG: hypothetical protein ACOYM4_17645, partial [Nodosilinea sp.]
RLAKGKADEIERYLENSIFSEETSPSVGSKVGKVAPSPSSDTVKGSNPRNEESDATAAARDSALPPSRSSTPEHEPSTDGESGNNPLTMPKNSAPLPVDRPEPVSSPAESTENLVGPPPEIPDVVLPEPNYYDDSGKPNFPPHRTGAGSH